MLAADDDARSLLRLLWRFRLRLGLERSLVLLVRGLMVSAMCVVGASVLEWLSGGVRVVELALLPLGGAPPDPGSLQRALPQRARRAKAWSRPRQAQYAPAG